MPGFSKLGVLCWEYEMSCRTLVRQPRFFRLLTSLDRVEKERVETVELLDFTGV